jgi:hypothetical protein
MAFIGSLINDIQDGLGWTYTMTETPLTGVRSLIAKAEIEVET